MTSGRTVLGWRRSARCSRARGSSGTAWPADDGVAQLDLTDPAADKVLAAYPTAERLVRMGKPIGVRVALRDIGGKELNDLVRHSWGSRAPKRLAASTPGSIWLTGGNSSLEGSVIAVVLCSIATAALLVIARRRGRIVRRPR